MVTMKFHRQELEWLLELAEKEQEKEPCEQWGLLIYEMMVCLGMIKP